MLVGLAFGRIAELGKHESGSVAADDLGIDGLEHRLQFLPLLALEVFRGAHDEAGYDAAEEQDPHTDAQEAARRPQRGGPERPTAGHEGTVQLADEDDGIEVGQEPKSAQGYGLAVRLRHPRRPLPFPLVCIQLAGPAATLVPRPVATPVQ